jgi:imidazoleglycerol-phosphate dehydratase
MQRSATISRNTNETTIEFSLAIDGSGVSSVKSGNGFMDHMLSLFAKHGLFDLSIDCAGDTEVDFHHSAEDIGICLGQALAQSLGDRRGISRFASVCVPMDESLARVCVDISGRPNLIYAVELADRMVSDFECDLAEDFFRQRENHHAYRSYPRKEQPSFAGSGIQSVRPGTFAGVRCQSTRARRPAYDKRSDVVPEEERHRTFGKATELSKRDCEG